MWTINLRLGLAEFFALASLLAVAGLLTLAFANGWTIALVPGLTYALAIGVTYVLYQQYASKEARASQPAALSTRFQVVNVQGVCPLGRRKGDLVTVDRAGSAVVPQLCPPAEAILRLAAAAGEEQEVKEWCCPIFDHLLVFRRELRAA